MRYQYLDSNTRTYPRTMRQAFGPYTDDHLAPEQDREARYIWPDRLLYSASILAMAVVFYVVITQ